MRSSPWIMHSFMSSSIEFSSASCEVKCYSVWAWGSQAGPLIFFYLCGFEARLLNWSQWEFCDWTVWRIKAQVFEPVNYTVCSGRLAWTGPLKDENLLKVSCRTMPSMRIQDLI